MLQSPYASATRWRLTTSDGPDPVYFDLQMTVSLQYLSEDDGTQASSVVWAAGSAPCSITSPTSFNAVLACWGAGQHDLRLTTTFANASSITTTVPVKIHSTGACYHWYGVVNQASAYASDTNTIEMVPENSAAVRVWMIDWQASATSSEKAGTAITPSTVSSQLSKSFWRAGESPTITLGEAAAKNLEFDEDGGYWTGNFSITEKTATMTIEGIVLAVFTTPHTIFPAFIFISVL